MDERSATGLTPWEREIFGAMMEVLQDALQQRDAQIAALAAKTPADWFKGSWLAGTRYRRGESVQKGNATYMCLTDTDEQPGHSSSWRLSSGR